MIKRFRRYQTVLSVIWVLLLFFGAFSYAMFQGGFVSWFIFDSFLLLFVYILVIVFYPLRDIQITRTLAKQEIFAHERLEVSLQIKRRLPIPLFYVVIEDQQLANGLKKTESHHAKKLFSLGFRLSATLHYTIEALPRGHYQFHTLSVRTGDMFGFIQKQNTVAVSGEVVVYPQRLIFPAWRPQAVSDEGMGHLQKSFEQDLTSVAGIRDYAPGDRLSWLDWKATARANQLMTKEFERPLDHDVLIVLDCFHPKQVDDGYLFEKAVSLVATLMDDVLRTSMKLQFMSIARHITFINEEAGDFQRWRILNHLAAVEQESQVGTPVKLSTAFQKLSQKVMFVFVTTSISDDLLLQFKELISWGLAIECFLVSSEYSLQDNQSRQNVLRSMGIVTHVITESQDIVFEQAGDPLAIY